MKVDKFSVLRSHCFVFLGFTIIAIVMTYPLAFVGDRAIVGTTIAEKDGWQKIWDMWWFRQSLLHGTDPFWTRHLYWPLGVNLLVYQTYAVSTLLLSLPVLLPFGPVEAYKFTMILNFALSGYTMFLFTHVLMERTAYSIQHASRVARPSVPALVAGLLYMATPMHLSRFADGSHLNAMQWLPLYLLVLALWLEEGHIWQGTAAVGMLVVLFFTSLYYTQFALVWTAAAVPVYALVTGRPLHTGVRAGLVIGGWALLCMPVLRQNLTTDIHYRDWLFRQRTHSMDLLDLFLPSDVHPLWSRFDLHRFTHPFGSWNVVPGIGVLLVGSYGLWRYRRTMWPWACLGFVMLLFALGPVLQVADHNLGIPLPHSLLNLTGAGKGSHRPGHFLVLTVVVLCLGVALALKDRSLRMVLAVGGVLFVLDCLPPVPWPVIQASPPPWLQVLGQVPAGSLVEVPFQHREVDYQLAQLWHGRPITGGYTSRTPPDPVMELPILNQLTGLQPPTIVGGDEAQQLRAALGGLCAGGLVIHSDPTNRDAVPLESIRQNVAAWLPEATLVYTDDPLVYALPLLPPEPLLLPDEGWYRLEQEGVRRWQWTEPQATVVLINPLAARLTVRLSFELKAAREKQMVHVRLDDTLLWRGQLGVAPIARTYRLGLVPGQVSRIHFDTEPVPEEGAGDRMLGLVFTELRVGTDGGIARADACPAALILPGDMEKGEVDAPRNSGIIMLRVR